MNKKTIISFILGTFCSLSIFAQKPTETLSIVPRPLTVQQLNGNFTINNTSAIVIEASQPELKKISEMLVAEIKSRTGKRLVIQTPKANVRNNSIRLQLNKAADTLGDEGYHLAVNNDIVTISANKPNGVFYGMQTLLQLLDDGSAEISAVAITDKPRFQWRGLMLDVGRYFYSIDFLKKYIDYMAMHKLNTFHWHLTEDHGWRIEIKKHPELTEIGAWREGTQYGKAASQIDHNPHGGYYTQEQIKDLIAYAKDRYINIVPEIEMPGHALSALVTYPQLSCTGGPFKMPVAWGIQKDVYCAGNEETYKFLEDVLTEVAELFPSPIIHIGGDECPKDRWKACPKCQAKIKAEHLKDEHELQSYFIKRIEKFLLTKNKRIIGWDEILEGGLAPNATVMSWRGIEGGIAAAKQHHDVVMTPTDYMYFDYYQGEPYLEPVTIGGMLPLKKVYTYEPIPSQLSNEEARYIKGVQANVWAEYIHSADRVEYMAFPRIAALSEVSWTLPKNKNWKDFQRRMQQQYKRYDKLGINYAKSAFNVLISDKKIDNNTATVTLDAASYQPEIRYTTDGSEPNNSSKIYTADFTIPLPGTVKAAVFQDGARVGKVSARSVLK